MDANTLGYVMAVLTIGITWISMRSAFFGLKLMAGMWWFVVFMYLKEKAPLAVTEGSGLHTAMLVVSIGIGLMIILAGMGRGISRKQTSLDGHFEVTHEGFHLPDWLKNWATGENPEQKKEKTAQSLEEYREQIHRALHQPRRR